MSKRDDVNTIYKTSRTLSAIEALFFIFNTLAAFISLSSNNTIREIAIIFQIVFALLYCICNTVDDGYFWYIAERERRKNAIQNGLGTRLSEYETECYYNNSTLPSLEKYGLNIFESNYFSKEIAEKMVPRSALATFATGFSLFVACRFLKDANVLLIISQTFFSSYILVNFIMLFLYKSRMKILYDEAYNYFILGYHTNNNDAWLISYIIEYEAIKAHYKIRLNETIFNSNNVTLSQNWEKILSHRAGDQKAKINK